MLTELQRRVATVFSSLDGASRFALAGGGASIVQGIVERPTDDLDFFATRPDEVNALVPEFVTALRAHGLVVGQDVPGFARLTVSDSADSTRVDLAADVRILAPVEGVYGLMLSSAELASDKVLAVFGRAEPRDFEDLAALEAQYPLREAMKLAAQKDMGFDVDVFRQMLKRFDRLKLIDFDMTAEGFAHLRETVHRWYAELGPDD